MITAACLLAVTLTGGGCSTGPADDDSASGRPDDTAPGDTEPGDTEPGDDRAGAGGELDDPAEVLPPTQQFPTRRVVLEDEDTRVPLAVHVAAEPHTRQQGLMGREDLPDRAGMLFLFPEEEHTGGFWMKDTLIPLSIAFFDGEGRVRRVLDMQPCEADPCRSYDPDVAYHGALEVNEGAFDELGLDGAGWRVRLPDDLPEPR